MVGVPGRDEVAAMEQFVGRHGLEHVTQVADVDLELWRRFGIVGQPAWVFVDAETGAVTPYLGSLTAEELTERIAALHS